MLFSHNAPLSLSSLLWVCILFPFLAAISIFHSVEMKGELYISFYGTHFLLRYKIRINFLNFPCIWGRNMNDWWFLCSNHPRHTHNIYTRLYKTALSKKGSSLTFQTCCMSQGANLAEKGSTSRNRDSWAHSGPLEWEPLQVSFAVLMSNQFLCWFT